MWAIWAIEGSLKIQQKKSTAYRIINGRAKGNEIRKQYILRRTNGSLKLILCQSERDAIAVVRRWNKRQRQKLSEVFVHYRTKDAGIIVDFDTHNLFIYKDCMRTVQQIKESQCSCLVLNFVIKSFNRCDFTYFILWVTQVNSWIGKSWIVALTRRRVSNDVLWIQKVREIANGSK